MSYEYDYTNLYNNQDAAQANAAANDYQQQSTAPQPPKKSSGTAKRVIAAVLTIALCFGAGLGGGYLGSSLNHASIVADAQSAAAQAAPSVATPTVSTGDALTVPEISAIVKPSVVSVSTEIQQTNPYFGSYVTAGAGSGVIISEDGYIITNQHVIDGASNVTVTLDDNTTYPAQVVGYDTDNDIAVLKVNATGLTPATIGSSANLVVGEFALAAGNPLGRLGGTVTEGIISALDREVTIDNRAMHLLQTSTGVSPGNSGGGLFNGKGELIGIVNARPSSADAEGISFAIPIDIAYEAAQNIIDHQNETPGNAIMGVTVITVSDAQTAAQYGVSTPGVYVRSVNEGGAADEAGIKEGDMIVAVDSTAVSTTDDLVGVLAEHRPGDKVEVQIIRDRTLETLEVTLQQSIEAVQIS